MKRKATISCLLLLLFCAVAPVDGGGYIVQMTKAEGNGTVWFICDITPGIDADAVIWDQGKLMKATIMNCTGMLP